MTRWILTLYGVMSFVTFLAYGWDKLSAKRGGRRVRERNLHLAALLGGWPGALTGQRVFRHKTRKRSFQRVFWLTLLPHLAGVGWLMLR